MSKIEMYDIECNSCINKRVTPFQLFFCGSFFFVNLIFFINLLSSLSSSGMEGTRRPAYFIQRIEKMSNWSLCVSFLLSLFAAFSVNPPCTVPFCAILIRVQYIVILHNSYYYYYYYFSVVFSHFTFAHRVYNIC